MVNSTSAQLIVEVKSSYSLSHFMEYRAYTLNENAFKCRDHTTLLMFYMLNQERIRKEHVTCVGDQSGSNLLPVLYIDSNFPGLL